MVDCLKFTDIVANGRCLASVSGSVSMIRSLYPSQTFDNGGEQNGISLSDSLILLNEAHYYLHFCVISW